MDFSKGFPRFPCRSPRLATKTVELSFLRAEPALKGRSLNG